MEQVIFIRKKEWEIKMQNKIQITKGIKFDYDDLIKVVDMSHEFTMRDVLTICMNSKISLNVLGRMLQCKYIRNYYDEMNSMPFKDQGDIEYLEIYWEGYKATQSDFSWSFHGIGKKGRISEDIVKYCKLSKKDKEEYREKYALDFSPIYSLADYPIKICNQLSVIDEDAKNSVDTYVKIDCQPSITLIELLHVIFWEISFNGPPEERNESMKKLKGMAKELDKAIKEGRLDEVTVPWKKVKRDLENKFGIKGKTCK